MKSAKLAAACRLCPALASIPAKLSRSSAASGAAGPARAGARVPVAASATVARSKVLMEGHSAWLAGSGRPAGKIVARVSRCR